MLPRSGSSTAIPADVAQDSPSASPTPGGATKEPVMNASLKKKVQKVLASNMEDEELLSALKYMYAGGYNAHYFRN